MTATQELLEQLIRCRSVTPEDAGCQALLIERLQALGFRIERLPFAEVNNFWARRGSAAPLLVFAGHTDVVPSGPPSQWRSDPFTPSVRGGYLYGRGAADMKSSLAAMVTACERYLASRRSPSGSIAFLVTSDEEGPAVNGTVKVVEQLQARGERIDYCLVGEPSSSRRLGDVIKNGRRGSLSAKLVIEGVQGHVAYPEQVRNPIHAAGPLISALVAEDWDQGRANPFFPPTSLQISNIQAGTGAGNVVPGEAELRFNFRFSTEVTADALKARVARIADARLGGCGYRLDWELSGQPFLTPQGELVTAAQRAIRDELGIDAQLSTAGGTSDGRFIAPTGAQVLEFGPVNATIHKIDECVSLADLEPLSRVYERLIRYLLER